MAKNAHNCGEALSPRSTKWKLLVIMKLTTLLLTICSLHLAAKVPAQLLNYTAKDKALEEVFSDVTKLTGYYFFFRPADIEHKKVSIEVKNVPLEGLLKKCLEGQGLTFSFKNKMVVIEKVGESKENKKSSLVGNTSDPIDVLVKVTNEEGEPVVGVTVQVKGGKIVGATNDQGVAKVKVESNSTLVFTAVNILTKEAPVDGRTDLPVKVQGSTGKLDEVQVVAYGTTSQRFTPGNVATVKAKDIERQPVQNPLLTLQGRVPGLIVTQNNGLSGGGVTVRIQGQNSIGKGNDPLYVVDGVPYFSQLPATGADQVLGSSGASADITSYGNPLNYLSVNDIESIDVLKDAEATAIYGSRAANGAILITTKKGKVGQLKFDVNYRTGIASVATKFKMLNTRQYLDMRYEALKNDGINLNGVSNTNRSYSDLKVWDTTRYTDWQDVLIGNTAHSNFVNATLNGGSEQLQFLISGNYNRETTVFPGDFSDEKGSIHFSIGGKSNNQKIRFQLAGSYLLDNNNLLSTDLTQSALLLEPVAPKLYNDDGSLNWMQNSAGRSTWNNPLSYLTMKYNNKTSSLISSASISFEVIKGLILKGNMGQTMLSTEDFSAAPIVSNRPESRPTSERSAAYGQRTLKSWIFEPQIEYKVNFPNSKLVALVGSSMQESNTNSSLVAGIGYNSDETLENKTAATALIGVSQISAKYEYRAIFGKINYTILDRYIISLNGRRDGTSRFGPNSQYQNFGSVAGAWLFDEERWAKKIPILSYGKIRVSYGSTGNDQIGDYAFLSLYNFLGTPSIPYQNSIGIFPAGIPNADLAWEQTTKLQTGVDIGVINDRVLVSATYSVNRSGNQLVQYSVPATTGVDNFVRNFPAKVQNTTWEFSINTTNIKRKGFQWTTNINATIPQNKLLAFPNLSTSSYARSLIIGQPLNVIKSYHFAGIDPETGRFQYFRKDGQITQTPTLEDYTYLNNTSPKYYGGMQNSVNIHGIEIDFLVQFVKQLGVNLALFNKSILPGQFTSTISNQPADVMNRWKNKGDNASWGKFTTSNNGYRLNNMSFTDASYIRLKNVSVSYRIKNKILERGGFKSIKIIVLAQNLLTFTKWKGLDPETQSYSSLPPLRQFTFGIQASL